MTAAVRRRTPAGDHSKADARTGRSVVRRALVAGAAATATLCSGLTACAERPSSAPAGAPASGLSSDAGTLGVASVGDPDGVLPGRVSPFDDGLPALANLDDDLLHAVQHAARDAQADGVEIGVTTGWRSRAYQQRLLDEAIARYGSEEEARRYVASPETSKHVTGDAVDIGPTDADSWLSRHGAAYGLCQTYANEIWHFELATSPGGDCPPMRRDASGN